MVPGRIRRVLPAVSGQTLILFSLLLLVLPLRWLLSAVLAAGVHEFCHLTAIRLCAGRVRGTAVGIRGARIWATELSAGKELLCALAGPVGGLLLLTLVRWLPRVALCALAQSLYNLLPVYPLDGGRALRCGASILLPPQLADRICRGIGIFCVLALALACLYGCFRLELGISALIPAGLLLWRLNSEKALANFLPTGYNIATKTDEVIL